MDVISGTLGVLSPTERAIQTLETAWINAVRRNTHLEKMKKDDLTMKNIPRSRSCMSSREASNPHRNVEIQHRHVPVWEERVCVCLNHINTHYCQAGPWRKHSFLINQWASVASCKGPLISACPFAIFIYFPLFLLSLSIPSSLNAASKHLLSEAWW